MTTGVANARSFGATGDGSTDDTVALQAAIDYCFGSASSPHGTLGLTQNKVLYIPPGTYKTTAPLLITRLHGGMIFGAGRGATKIHNVTGGATNGTVIRTNGMGYSHISDLYLQTHTGGICLDFDWDNTSGGAALQANTIEDIFCYGSGETGTIGVRIANQTYMGSEFIFKMLHNQECALAGVLISSGAFNSLQHQFYGGQDQACGVGIWATVGCAPVISGRGFQAQTVCDIKTSGGQHNAMSITGCRTESENFIINEGGQSLDISACLQTTTGTPGFFVQSAGGYVHMRACETDATVNPYYWCKMTIDGCSIDTLQMDAAQIWYIPNNATEGNVFIRNSLIGSDEICDERRFTTNGSTITTLDRSGVGV